MKLEVRNLRKSFGEKEVLHGISFSVKYCYFCTVSRKRKLNRN